MSKPTVALKKLADELSFDTWNKSLNPELRADSDSLSMNFDFTDDEDKPIYTVCIFAKDSFPIFSVTMCITSLEIPEERLSDVIQWIFDCNQELKIGCYKLNEEQDRLIYYQAVEARDLINIETPLISNMWALGAHIIHQQIESFLEVLSDD